MSIFLTSRSTISRKSRRSLFQVSERVQNAPSPRKIASTSAVITPITGSICRLNTISGSSLAASACPMLSRGRIPRLIPMAKSEAPSVDRYAMTNARRRALVALPLRDEIEGAMNPTIIRGTIKKIICPHICRMARTGFIACAFKSKPAQMPITSPAISQNNVLLRIFDFIPVWFIYINNGVPRLCAARGFSVQR